MRAFSVGKPSPLMMRAARKELGLATEETIMIGDTMETDILGGVQLGFHTVLVLSGSSEDPRVAAGTLGAMRGVCGSLLSSRGARRLLMAFFARSAKATHCFLRAEREGYFSPGARRRWPVTARRGGADPRNCAT